MLLYHFRAQFLTTWCVGEQHFVTTGKLQNRENNDEEYVKTKPFDHEYKRWKKIIHAATVLLFQ